METLNVIDEKENEIQQNSSIEVRIIKNKTEKYNTTLKRSERKNKDVTTI